jgi:hypothetical protein
VVSFRCHHRGKKIMRFCKRCCTGKTTEGYVASLASTVARRHTLRRVRTRTSRTHSFCQVQSYTIGHLLCYIYIIYYVEVHIMLVCTFICTHRPFAIADWPIALPASPRYVVIGITCVEVLSTVRALRVGFFPMQTTTY